MTGRVIDIIEDMDKGLNMEQLVQKPTTKGDESTDGDNNRDTSTGKNA